MNAVWFLSALFFLLPQAPPPDHAEFPLEKGNYWVYQGNVAWTDGNTKTVQRRSIQWRMEVTDVISRGLVVGVVLRGHPHDLIDFEPKRQPGVYVILQVHQRKYYLLAGERAQLALKRLQEPSDLLIDLVRDNEIFLETPITLGQRFCEAGMMTRDDWMNCWFVEEERTPTVKSLPGVAADWDGPEWGIVHRSLPSAEFLGFAPGIGLTSYDFGHNGSVSEVQLKLTEFRLSSP